MNHNAFLIYIDYMVIFLLIICNNCFIVKIHNSNFPIWLISIPFCVLLFSLTIQNGYSSNNVENNNSLNNLDSSASSEFSANEFPIVREPLEQIPQSADIIDNITLKQLDKFDNKIKKCFILNVTPSEKSSSTLNGSNVIVDLTELNCSSLVIGIK